MNGNTPHIVQYQGSKRKLASQILQYIPKHNTCIVEPFAGTAAISIAAATQNISKKYYVNDLNKPLLEMMKCAIENPQILINEYTAIWSKQFDYGENHIEHFYEVRNMFNKGDTQPAVMLYLLARCVKGSVRYGANGNFNQSPDKRRHGTSPKNMETNVLAVSRLLKGKTEFSAIDYRDVLEKLQPSDLVYFDPPYQGVCNTRDHRYFSSIDFNEFIEALSFLNSKNIDFIVSYDGSCGDKSYGKDLPSELGCKKIMLNAGKSSQSILLGKPKTTFESLYLSKNLATQEAIPSQLTLFGAA